MSCVLFDAIDQGDLHEIASWVEIGPNINTRYPIELEDPHKKYKQRSSTPLERACVNSTLEVVALLIKLGADVNAKGVDDRTPLFLAMSRGNLDIVRYLCDHGADIHVKLESSRNTLLHQAVYLNRLDMCKELMKRGVNKYIANRMGNLAFHYAIHQSHYEIMEYFLSVDPKFIRKPDYLGRLPIHLAIQDGARQENLLRLCFRYGANVNAKGPQDETPLHYTMYFSNGHSFIPLLLERGADIHAKTKDGFTAFGMIWKGICFNRWSSYNTHLQILLSNGANPCIDDCTSVTSRDGFGTIEDVRRKYKANWTIQFLMACVRKRERIQTSSIRLLPRDILRRLHEFLR